MFLTGQQLNKKASEKELQAVCSFSVKINVKRM